MPLWDPNLTWLPIAPLMLVKEPSDLALKLSCAVQLAHRNGVFKKFALEMKRPASRGFDRGENEAAVERSGGH
jgi:hypothetical protein